MQGEVGVMEVEVEVEVVDKILQSKSQYPCVTVSRITDDRWRSNHTESQPNNTSVPRLRT